MGQGQHKIKRKAEQIACNEAIEFIKTQPNEVLPLPLQEIKEISENIMLEMLDE